MTSAAAEPPSTIKVLSKVRVPEAAGGVEPELAVGLTGTRGGPSVQVLTGERLDPSGKLRGIPETR